MNYLSLLHILAPEIGLVLLAFAVLAVDLFGLREQPVVVRSKWLGVATAVGLVIAALILAARIGEQSDPKAAYLLGGTLVVDNLALFFKVVILALTVLTALISMGGEFTRHVGEYYALLIFCALGMMFLVSSEELIILFTSLELLSLCLYILTAFAKAERRSGEAAWKYFAFGALSSAFLLFGLSYLYGLTGEMSLEGIGRSLAAASWTVESRVILWLAILFTLVGFGFKVAVVPFHLWAPDAYEGAPTPVTALIATGSKVASFVALLKVAGVVLASAPLQGAAWWHPFSGELVFRSGWVSLLVVLSALSMVVGNLAALVQRNIKRLLAYSSIAHGGYVLLGVLAPNDLGHRSVLFYLLVYGLANVGAFGVVQALAGKAGGETLEHFRGMARRAPFLSLMMLVFVLSLAGIPPLGGFFGKFYLFLAAAKVHHLGLLWLVILGIATSAVSLYYYLVLLKQMYVEKATDEAPIAAPLSLRFATASAALLILVLGVFPSPVLTILEDFIVRSCLMPT